MGTIARTSHEDPVCFAGLSYRGEEVGPVVVLSKDVPCIGVTVAPVMRKTI